MRETPALDERMLDVQMRDYAEAPNDRLLADVFYLRSRGVRVSFFEMPVNPRLISLPKAQRIREAIHAAFPAGRFPYIELPSDWASYVTTDGIHLTPMEASRYTQYFLE
jgi:hypothetical protein